MSRPCSYAADEVEFVISMADARGLLCSLWRGGAAIVRSGPSEWSRSQISREKRSETYITLEKLLLPVRRNNVVDYPRRRAGVQVVLLVGMPVRGEG